MGRGDRKYIKQINSLHICEKRLNTLEKNKAEIGTGHSRRVLQL